VSKIDITRSPGLKVTVMGLGINGGGLASAQFFARHGARVTATDLRGEKVLKETMDRLSGLEVRYVLDHHEERDFTEADLVIKNPAVSPSSPYLAAAREHGVPIETDLSLFFSLSKNPIIAVTGSKGKSTTASAIHHGLLRIDPRARLGGNITVSPLTFLDELQAGAPVVLELSSWQLGDLAGRGLLKPAVSVFTVILPDHLDKYPGMAEYVADKKALFMEQEEGSKAVFNLDDPWQKDFPSQTRAKSFFYSASGPLPEGVRGAWLEGENGYTRLDAGAPKTILSSAAIPGRHNLTNLLCAGLALSLYGAKAEVVRKAMGDFPGVEHRLEMFHTWRGARFYNDSAATIPHAVVKALEALPPPVVLITGGTDKNIDFSPLKGVMGKPETVILLAGTGSEKIRRILEDEGIRYLGPFPELIRAVRAALERARDGMSVLFSPGCTSFGMFLNEFDRGRKFKEAVRTLAQ
jgi:UDP-N-acetylmuramoylalanine--D-glutamate ligase